MYGSVKRKHFSCVDVHCGGEPARILISGYPSNIPGLCKFTVTFVAQIQFRPDTFSSVPDLIKCEVSKYQKFDGNYEYITLKP